MNIDEKNRMQDALDILHGILLDGDITNPEQMTQAQRRGEMVQAAKNAIEMRNTRRKILGPQFSSDPCWDLLLCLYTKWVEAEPVSVTNLVHETGVPIATVVRWLTALTDKEMTIRYYDPSDGRRTWIKLTQFAIGQIEEVLAAQVFGGYFRRRSLPLAA